MGQCEDITFMPRFTLLLGQCEDIAFGPTLPLIENHHLFCGKLPAYTSIIYLSSRVKWSRLTKNCVVNIAQSPGP